MNIANRVDFLTVVIYLAVVAAIVYAAMIFAVGRKIIFRSPLEMHFPRVWREHKRYFPDSRARKILVILFFALTVCAMLDRFLR
jgi:hypothetical protein